MPNDLPTRRCDGCGQIWSSGRFLDPTAEVDCGFCGASLPHRRRLPDSVAVELGRMGEPGQSAPRELPASQRSAIRG
jgi:hypothetical protein